MHRFRDLAWEVVRVWDMVGILCWDKVIQVQKCAAELYVVVAI